MKIHSKQITAVTIPLMALVIVSMSMGNAYAHKSEVIGDYKIEIGWENEPPVAGIDNSIELVISYATEFEKSQSTSENHEHAHEDDSMDMEHDDAMDMEHDDAMEAEHDDAMEAEHDDAMEAEHDDAMEAEHDDAMEAEHDDAMEAEHDDAMEAEHDDAMEMTDFEEGEKIPALEDSLQLWITLGEDKTELSLEESDKFPGVYYAKYMPESSDFPIVDVHGEIMMTDIDVQMHPEEVEPLSTLAPIKQMNYGIDPSDVECKEGLDLFMRTNDSSAVCIGQKLEERLMGLGIIDYF